MSTANSTLRLIPTSRIPIIPFPNHHVGSSPIGTNRTALNHIPHNLLTFNVLTFGTGYPVSQKQPSAGSRPFRLESVSPPLLFDASVSGRSAALSTRRYHSPRKNERKRSDTEDRASVSPDAAVDVSPLDASRASLSAAKLLRSRSVRSRRVVSGRPSYPPSCNDDNARR